MAIVIKRGKGETKDEIIGKFRRVMIEEDIVEEVKARTGYIKPSAKRYAIKKVTAWRDKCRRKAGKSRNYVAK